MANKQVNVILSLKDKYSVPMFQVAEGTEKASNKMKHAVASANKGVLKFEKTMDKMMKWVKRIGIAGAGMSLKVGWDGIKELDDGARKVKSIAKEALDLGDIKDGLLSISSKTGMDVKDIAEAQYMAISSSVDPKESLAYAELATKIGKAGFADPREAIDLVTSMQNAYGEKGMGSAMKMADQFLHTQNRGKIEVGQMTQTYGKLIPIFAEAGVKHEELNAAMATLTKMGMKPAEASTALAGAMRTIINPTDKTKEALKGLGLEFSASELKAHGFGGMMEKVMKATKGDMDKITKIFPNARAMLAGASLGNEEGMKEFKAILKELEGQDVKGSLDTAYDTIQGSIGNQWEILKKNLKNTNTKFYMQYEGNLAEKLQQINKWFEDNPEKIDKFVQKVSDAINKVIDALGKFFKFLWEHKDTITTVAKALFGMYLALKLMRGVSSVVGTVKTFAELLGGLGGGIALGGLGKVLITVGLIVGGLALINKKIKSAQDKLQRNRDKMQPSGDNQPQYSLDGMIDTEEMTDAENSFLRIGESIKNIKTNLVELKDKIVDFVENIRNSGLMEILEIWLYRMFPILRVLDAVKSALPEVLDGIFEVVDGILDILNGDFVGGVKKIFEGLVKVVRGIWGGLVEFVTSPIDAIVRLIDNKFGEKAKAVTDAWDSIKKAIKNPITATVNWVENKAEKRRNRKTPTMYNIPPSRRMGETNIYSRAKGDNHWQGGIVQVSERGGEILDLPHGTRIYPHDKSIQMAMEEGLDIGGRGKEIPQPASATNVSLNIYGNVYGEDDLMDKVGNRLVKAINGMNNM